MDNNINSYYGENIEELTQSISNDTMGQLQDIDMLDFYMTVMYGKRVARSNLKPIKTMSKYVILGCDHNMNDCIDSWAISLTEYGLCVVYEKPDNISSPASSLGSSSNRLKLFWTRFLSRPQIETSAEQPDRDDEQTDPRSQYEQVVEKREVYENIFRMCVHFVLGLILVKNHWKRNKHCSSVCSRLLL